MQYSFLRSPLTLLAVALAGAAAPSHATDKTVSVAVTSIVEHKALDAVRDGVRDELKASGFEPVEVSATGFETGR